MTGTTNDVPRLRMSIVAVVALALFTSLFARLYDLQIVASPEFQVQAEANRVRVVQVPAPRGRILDREGKVLVDNRVAAVVTIDRHELSQLPDREQDAVLLRLTAELTGAGVDTDPGKLRARLDDQRFSRYAPVPVATGVPEELKIYLEEHPELFPAVDVERAAVRDYPYGTLAAHTLGYVGKIDQPELEAVADERVKPYSLNDFIGKSGVERTYERYLRGTPGTRRIEVDANGDPVRVISERLPRPGDDIVLSLDADTQALAEQKLVQGLEEARARPTRTGNEPNNGHKGAVAVVDPRNGQVIALASRPTYDPDMLVDGIDLAEMEHLEDPANHFPLNNWAIQGQWAPGSTYKLFVGYAALMSGLMAPDTVFYDQGGYQIPGCTGLKCYRRNAGGASYGRVTISRAITISSDSYFYNVGARFWLEQDRLGGADGMQQHLRPFGLGERTGIDLTGERPGRVPTPGWKQEFNERLGGDTVWRSGDSVNMAIGQGDVLVTPLQLANGYATFANGGTRYRPQIALRAEAYGTGEVTEEFASEVEGEVDLPEHFRLPLLEGLTNVPVSGTATSAFAGFPLDRYPIAGKTGTAEVDDKADTAVFAAFGPAPDPKYSVAVMLEESGFGGTAAAPVARAMFDVLSGATPKPTVEPGGQLDVPADPLEPVGGSYD